MTNAEVYMTLIRYLDQVQCFYNNQPHPDRMIKLERIRQVVADARDMKRLNPLEYGAKILSIRRILLSFLPIWGYPERDALEQLLNVLLEGCRESIFSPVLKSPKKL